MNRSVRPWRQDWRDRSGRVPLGGVRRGFAVLALAGAGLLGAAAPPEGLVARWAFEGNLRDDSGRGISLFARAPQFVAGHRGQGLRTGAAPALAPDRAELRLAPGLLVDCWVQLGAIPADGLYFLVKEDEYMLRVDPAGEGGQFAFFVSLDGWEPRVRSKVVPKPGVWYHLEAGWDGHEATLAVDGDRARVPRAGTAFAGGGSLRLDLRGGVIDDLEISNPNARQSGVAYWPFDGDLRDASGHGHDLVAPAPRFVPGQHGQALQGGAAIEVPSHADLQIAPGFRIDATVRFETLPPSYGYIAIKEGEYQLRVDSPQEGGRFSFFVNLGGWEPRVQAPVKAQVGVWYRLVAAWDGSTLSLDVDGQHTEVRRSGTARPDAAPLVLGTPGILLDDLRIENPRLAVLSVRPLTQATTLLRAGRPETLTAVVRNLGAPVPSAVATLEVRPGVACLGERGQDLGPLATGAEKTLQWTVRAETSLTSSAGVRLTAPRCRPVSSYRALAFFPAGEGPVTAPALATPRGDLGATYYVDGLQGNNANPGTSPEAAWRDFTPINGKTLGPGERLLIRRGSVIAPELRLTAAGTPERWAEIGAYGDGPRPIIRGSWDLDDRCVLVTNPDYLRIRSLVVGYAGKGLVVNYSESGHRGLVIEDCIAHHIEGLYRTNAHGIPEWRDRLGAAGDSLHSSAGIAVVGAPAQDLVVRDCEVFQCSWGFFVMGDAVTVDRVYCHDNAVHNTSPHPAMVAVRRAFLQNSLFDAPGWHASAGTMGIMLVDPQGLVIRNCTFRNQPDSGSHDEGGIDFENSGDGCLIEGCTFENNAGAAIEVLGLKVPQPRNVEIAASRFILNNTARKLGPAEIYIWGQPPSPDVCCSTGSIRGNGYVLRPGIGFFVNEAPKTTSWVLKDNIGYDTPEALRQAMPFNEAPRVDAGPDRQTDQRRVALAGQVRDDGRPAGRALAVRWEVVEGPGAVTFAPEGAAATTAEFGAAGDYLLRLVGDDGELWLSDLVAVHILPAGSTVAAAWEFNTPHDKQGWTEVNPGTRLQEWNDQDWPTRSEPVKYVAGGFYVLALDASPDAHLLSPDTLAVDLAARQTVRLRFQNHTPATRMRLAFTTAAAPTWDDAHSRSFEVVANDREPRVYAVDMSGVPGWTGRLKQLRLDLATGSPLTGTCRLDYVWIETAGAAPAR